MKSRLETQRSTRNIIGCGCDPCLVQREKLEAGTLLAMRADYRLYDIATRGGAKPTVNDHGHHSWIFLPSWMLPVIELMDIVGSDFLIRSIQLMSTNSEFRDAVLVTYRLGGGPAVEQLLRRHRD